ncbi:MAG: hypothetical protein JNK72_12835 [Myxococcales bacterium]|nr:hypothetical protein [Myxococcales bacterium]
MRLQEALELLSGYEREALRQRRGIKLDPRKRLDDVEQTARALVAETDLRHSRLPAEVRHLLQRLVAANGLLSGASMEPAARPLLDLGIAYTAAQLARKKVSGGASKADASGHRLTAGSLLLPSAFLVQVPVGESEDPRCLRACLSMVDAEIIGPMAQQVMNKPVAITGAMALQEVWETLAVPGYLEQIIRELPVAEARLLDGIERYGGEVDTQELLALDQAPGLYRTQSGIAVPKRGAPYALQRKGLLFQLGVERFVMPTEVVRIVGAARQAERVAKRAEIEAAVRDEDYVPQRARHAKDPSLTAVAALCLLRHWGVALRPDVGVARAAMRRASERLNESEETVTLLVTLARAAGLGRMVTPNSNLGIGGDVVTDVGPLLWKTYQQGGAWDETRIEPEVLRSGLVARGTAVVQPARLVLLDALEAVAREKWATPEAVRAYAQTDPRYTALVKLHERAIRERPDVFYGTIDDAWNRMMLRTMPVLGALDVAEDGSAVRLSGRMSRDRDRGSERPPTPASVYRHDLNVSGRTRLVSVIELADVCELERVNFDSAPGVLVFAVGASALAHSREVQHTPEFVEARLKSVGLHGPYPPVVRELLSGIGVAGDATMIALAGVIMVEDPEIREALRADATFRKMLVELDAGDLFLVRADADIAKLQARIGRHGLQWVEKAPESVRPSELPPGDADTSRVVKVPPPAKLPSVEEDTGSQAAPSRARRLRGA